MLVSAFAFALALRTRSSAETPLWTIGRSDASSAEFGLAPGGYARYGEDPFYVVGSSSSKDWPYVLPGPADGWAHDRDHEGTIVFGLRGVSPSASTRLTIDFAGTHPSSPPDLQLVVNGKPLTSWQAPVGDGDDVVLGRAATGKTARWVVDVPGAVLKNGNNTISLRNARGSWVVYDALRLEGSPGLSLAPVRDEMTISALRSRQAILRTPQGDRQPLTVGIVNVGPARKASLAIEGGETVALDLKPGRQTVEVPISPVRKTRDIRLSLRSQALSAVGKAKVAPVRPWKIFLFPHSHVDIGYTDLQDDVLRLHERNLTDAIAVGRESSSNPTDSRYRFHVEATWVLDRYLQKATPRERSAVVDALRGKTLGLSGGYANLLTGMMHPEELMQSYRYSRILGESLGVDFDTASQTDVPGVTWGDVVALHEAGIRNLVLMPNAGDRVGGVHRAWQDRPFWWVGPSGKERILVWQTDPYSVGVGAGWDGDRNRIVRTQDPSGRFIEGFLFPKLERLVERGYPYDMIGEPWSVNDNAPVDADVPAAAKAWNEKYRYPHVVVSTLSDACRELSRRYGAKLPIVKGDYTPYWEDGIGSSAIETALNRATPDRLIQAETLYAMDAVDYPAEDFLEAWRNVILFSEHTWGAAQSVWKPDDPEVAAQWAIKREFAQEGDRSSKRLLARRTPTSPSRELDVVNTLSWSRTGLVTISTELSQSGDRVETADGTVLPSQRLRTGELAVWVREVPPLGQVRLRIVPGMPGRVSGAAAEGSSVRNERYTVSIDPKLGAITSIHDAALGREWVDRTSTYRLGQYLYLPGEDLKNLETNADARFETIEPGPLVAILRVRSTAPGTRGLTQDVRLEAGSDRVELTETVDKLPVRAKEGVHFAFPLSVPHGQMRIDLPWAVVRPEQDQLEGANKNWLTTQGYVDVSNAQFGVTCASIDAPLIEVGDISANLLGSVADPNAWRQRIAPTQTFYSWSMNNHWHTNYRADQAGPTTFRYVLQGHRAFSPSQASRLAMEARRPLLVRTSGTKEESLFTLDDASIVATRVCPSDDGKAVMVRLWNASPSARRVRPRWRSDLGPAFRSDLSQKPYGRIGDSVSIAGWGVTTLRVERRP